MRKQGRCQEPAVETHRCTELFIQPRKYIALWKVAGMKNYRNRLVVCFIVNSSCDDMLMELKYLYSLAEQKSYTYYVSHYTLMEIIALFLESILRVRQQKMTIFGTATQNIIKKKDLVAQIFRFTYFMLYKLPVGHQVMSRNDIKRILVKQASVRGSRDLYSWSSHRSV